MRALLIAVTVLLLAAEFVAPIGGRQQNRELAHAPPNWPRLERHEGRWRWVVDALRRGREGWSAVGEPKPLQFWHHGATYRLLGLLPTDLHLLGTTAPAAILWLGCDALGRDRFARALEACRASFLLAVAALLCATAFAALAGGWAGWSGGPLDRGLTALTDVLLALPGLFLLLAMRSALPLLPPRGADLALVLGVLALSAWVPLTKLALARSRALRLEGFCLAATACGAGPLRVVRAHLLPGLWAPLRAQALALLPVLVVAETSLSYLGLGLKEPNSGLGGLIAQISLVEALSRPWLLAPLLFLAGLLVLLAANARGGRAGGGWETV